MSLETDAPLTAGPDARFQNFRETGTAGGQAGLALRASRDEPELRGDSEPPHGPVQDAIPDAIRTASTSRPRTDANSSSTPR